MRHVLRHAAPAQQLPAALGAALPRPPAFAPVRAALAGYTPAPGVKLDHPYFMGPHPCTMLIEEVEAIWAPIAERDDWSLFAVRLEAIEVMADAYGTLI